MTVSDFRKLTSDEKYRTPAYKSWDDLERKYWKGISYNSPIYGADVNGTLFGEEINTWNVAQLDTLLDFINENEGIRIAGVTNPYLYFGMWRATFPWHVEGRVEQLVIFEKTLKISKISTERKQLKYSSDSKL